MHDKKRGDVIQPPPVIEGDRTHPNLRTFDDASCLIECRFIFVDRHWSRFEAKALTK